MAVLIVSKDSNPSQREVRFHLTKRMTTVGSESVQDVVVKSDSPGLLFSILKSQKGIEISPARAKVKVNGQVVSGTKSVGSCDRIEWPGGSAVVLDSALSAGESMSESKALESLLRLQNIAASLENSGNLNQTAQLILDSLIEFSGAERAFLIGDFSRRSKWSVIVSRSTSASTIPEVNPSRREVLSSTILNEALKKRDLVYVENMIGHPWSEADSIIQARIFSVACFPLILNGEVFGAVLLTTSSPGRFIRRETLSEVTLFASQAALLLTFQVTAKAKTSPEVLTEADGKILYTSGSPMEEVTRKVAKVAATPLSVLIQGASGTGKELIAREIHEKSARKNGPFVAINCAAIPASLLESTLFGYEKGAFTGAVKSHSGKFVQADGGTLFLDEIGDLPLELQAKILRALQEKKVDPVGATASVAVDVRIVSATHQNLEQMIQAARFRQDLFFRLNGISITLPSLKERPMDIEGLAKSFIAKAGSAIPISSSALAVLKSYDWPGNVRELEQAMTRAALLSDGPEIQPEDLGIQTQDFSTAPARATALSVEFNGQSLEEAQEAFTLGLVESTLNQLGGNRAAAAQALGISERTLYRLLTKLSDKSGSRSDLADPQR
ncbi:MAG: sigma-54-dependent Fis family transcriptional regulator [Bdellovibrionales bacterium]|nr:sigma-54-dependent Fis family transcriptional regulator [Bdellovibrionales bacterium]